MLMYREKGGLGWTALVREDAPLLMELPGATLEVVYAGMCIVRNYIIGDCQTGFARGLS